MKKDKIIFHECPRCGKVFPTKSVCFFIEGDSHPRCDDCGQRLIRRRER